MKSNSELHHRKSIRIKNYDYSQAGYYYITICSYNRNKLFGKIANGLMVLNGLGKIVEEELLKTEEIRQYVNIDYYCIMPNHIHFILIINENCMDIASRVPTESFGKPVHNSLPTIIRSIKSAITKRINEIRNTPGNSVWHHGFYEHIIRNEQELHEIRQYIENNPINWQNDEYRD